MDGGKSTLTIKNIRQGDGGPYTCRSSNKAGSTESQLFLKVFGEEIFIFNRHILSLLWGVCCCVVSVWQRKAAVQTGLLFFFHLVAFHSNSLEENEAMRHKYEASSAVNAPLFQTGKWKTVQLSWQNSSSFFIGPGFNLCFHEAAVHIQKLIILIGPPVFAWKCMEIYSPPSRSKSRRRLFFRRHIYMTLLLGGSFVVQNVEQQHSCDFVTFIAIIVKIKM